MIDTQTHDHFVAFFHRLKSVVVMVVTLRTLPIFIKSKTTCFHSERGWIDFIQIFSIDIFFFFDSIFFSFFLFSIVMAVSLYFLLRFCHFKMYRILLQIVCITSGKKRTMSLMLNYLLRFSHRPDPSLSSLSNSVPLICTRVPRRLSIRDPHQHTSVFERKTHGTKLQEEKKKRHVSIHFIFNRFTWNRMMATKHLVSIRWIYDEKKKPW